MYNSTANEAGGAEGPAAYWPGDQGDFGPDRAAACRPSGRGGGTTEGSSAQRPGGCRNDDRFRDQGEISRLLRIEGAPACAFVFARAGAGPYAALHERRHEPVQGHLPGKGGARLPARRKLAEVHASVGQAQRPGAGRPHAAPPHLLRDARQLLVRRLFQAGRDRPGVAAADRRVEDAERSAGGLDFQGRRQHSTRRRGV